MKTDNMEVIKPMKIIPTDDLKIEIIPDCIIKINLIIVYFIIIFFSLRSRCKILKIYKPSLVLK